MPAAQEVESRRSHCFFTMSSSNRWARTSAAESSAQAQSSNRGQEYRDSQYDEEVRRSEPSAGYALRRSEVIPDNQFRTSDTLPGEDHLAFSNGYRRRTEWFHAHGKVRQRRNRNLYTVLGPNDMTATDRHQMLMDVVSWILIWGKQHREFDDSLRWIAEFLKYLCGFTTQDEEDWFDELCNKFHIDMTGQRRDGYI